MSTTVDEPTRQAQLDAVAASGVTERFHLIQLRNPAFWVFTWGVVVGSIRMFTFYRPGVENYGGALVAGTVAFGVYAVIWLLFLHWMDRYTPLQPALLATGFLWGALAATLFIALTVNTALLTLYGKWFGPTWAHDWGAGFTAPFTEETAKVIGFVLLLGLAGRQIRSVYDAFILGAFIGLGFEVAEDVLYVFEGANKHFGTTQVADSIQIIALRSASGLVSHALFSALVCAGLMWILGRDPRGRNVAKGLLLIVTGMILHGCWDVSAPLGKLIGGEVLAAVMTPILLIVGIVIILVVGKDASLSERRWARAILAPEVERGFMTEVELDIVTGTHKDRRRFVKDAKKVGGRHTKRVAKHVVAAGRELGEALGRAGGDDTDTVDFARHELARVRAD